MRRGKFWKENTGPEEPSLPLTLQEESCLQGTAFLGHFSRATLFQPTAEACPVLCRILDALSRTIRFHTIAKISWGGGEVNGLIPFPLVLFLKVCKSQAGVRGWGGAIYCGVLVKTPHNE